MLIGQGNFQEQHRLIQNQLQALQIPFARSEQMVRDHSWHSGWLSIAFEWLLPRIDVHG